MTTLANLTTYFAGESASFLSAIEKSRGGLRALVKELDPVSAATDKFNKQQALLDNGLKRGALTAEQHGAAVSKLRTRYDEHIASLTKLNGTSGAARAGMQQLSFQIGDVAQGFNAGTPFLVIFGQQFGHIIQAISLMQTKSTGLLGFLGGPWGAVLSAAAVVTVPLITRMFELGDAAKEAKDRMAKAAEGADAWGDAQSLLGKMVALTTGKIKDQNDALRASILLQAIQSKQAAAEEAREARKAIGAQANRKVGGFAALTPGGTGVGQVSEVKWANAELSRLAQGFFKGSIKTTDAIGQLQALQSQGKITQKVFDDLSTQFVEFAQATEKGKASQAILDYLDSGKLDPRLRQDKPERPKRDRSAQQLERYTRELESLQDEELSLRGQLTEDVGLQAKLEHERLEGSTEAYAIELGARVQQKELTQAQADSLLAQRQINDQKRHALINWKLDDQLLQQDLMLKRAGLDNQSAILQGQLSMARTAEERRKLQLELLDNEIEMQRATLQAVLARHDTTEIEKKIAQAKLDQLDREKGQAAAQIDRQNAGPLRQYLDGIPRTAAEINESFEIIAVDGLAQLNDGLAQAAMGTKSLGDVFSSVTNQILGDILRIVIQQQLIKPLASLLGRGAGGGDWLAGVGGDTLGLGSLGLMPGEDTLGGILNPRNPFGSTGGGLFGGVGGIFAGMAGRGLFGKLIGFADGGSFQIGGKGGIDQNVLSINGIPRAMVSASELVNITPGSDRRGGRPLIIQVVGEEGAAFVPRVAGISGETSAVHVQAQQRRSSVRQRQRLA